MTLRNTTAGLALAAALVLATALGSGCREEPPTAKDAARIAKENAATLVAIDETLRAAVAELPGAGADPKPCPPGGASAIGVRERLACIKALREHRQARDAALGTIRDEAHALLKRRGVVGLSLAVKQDFETEWQTLFRVALADPAFEEGGVNVGDGQTVDGRRVGWGRLRTAYRSGDKTFGDDTFRTGVEVVWTFSFGVKTYRVSAVVLADHHPTDAWRAGWRARSSS